MTSRRGMFASCALVLVGPVLMLIVRALKHDSLNASFEVAGLLPTLLRSAAQAFVSATAALALGTIGAAGLCWAANRGRAIEFAVRGAALLPSAAPALLAILTWSSIAPGIRGIGAVIAVNATMFGGAVAVAIESAMRSKLVGMAELSLCEGASRRSFWVKGALPALASDLRAVWLFAFAACFASFSVPLALGGASAASLEVVAFQRARVSGDLAGAVAAAVLQTLFILLIVVWSPIGFSTPVSSGRASRLRVAAWAPGAVLVALPGIALAASLARSAVIGLGEIRANPELSSGLWKYALGSFASAGAAGLLVILFFFGLAFVRPEGTARRLLLGYAVPSATAAGLALWFWLPTGGAWSIGKIALGSALVFAPALNRLRWDAALQGLAPQAAVARALGASDGAIFLRVTLPQLWETAFSLGGLAAFWAWGEFALASIVSDRRTTLAMAASAMMNSYRLDAAFAVLAMALAGGGFTYLLFAGVGRVGRS